MSAISMTWPQYRRGCCIVDGEQVYLSPSQTEILLFLLMRRGRVIEREELWELVWPDPEHAPNIKIIDVQVYKLRRRLGGLIETVWGRGYVIHAPHEQLRRAA